MIPENISLEENVLAILLNDYEGLYRGDVLQMLKSSDFYLQSHQVIYRAMVELTNRKVQIDMLTVIDILHKQGKLENAGGQEKIAQLAGTLVGHFSQVSNYVTSLIDYSVLRELKTLFANYSQDCADPNNQPDLIIQECQSKLLELSDRRKSADAHGLTHISELLPGTLDDIERLNSDEPQDVYLNTGLADLDKITGGLQPGTMTVLAGRSGAGKTTVALDFAYTFASKQQKVAYFSLEMTKDQVIKKLIARGAAGNKIKSELEAQFLFQPKGLAKVPPEVFADGVGRASELSLWIDDTSTANLPHIKGELNKLSVSGDKPDVVFIDYVAIMGSSGRFQNRVLELDYVLKDLRAMAKDMNINLFALAQINRGVELRGDKRPGLADIRECGSYEQEAAVVIGIYNPTIHGDMSSPGTSELIVLKNRFGATGKAIVGFQPQYNRLVNFAKF